MAQWHLNDLRAIFERYGWSIIAELPGDDYSISGSWELRRGGDASVLVIDFEGLDDMSTLPIHEAYACRIRGSEHSRYFGRRGNSGSAARDRWRSELVSFVMEAGPLSPR
jgi:hypothetical protein